MEGFHRIGRIILAATTVLILAAVRVLDPTVSIETLAVISAPALGYIGIKGVGKPPE